MRSFTPPLAPGQLLFLVLVAAMALGSCQSASDGGEEAQDGLADSVLTAAYDSAIQYLKNNKPNVKLNDTLGRDTVVEKQGFRDGKGFKFYWVWLNSRVENVQEKQLSQEEMKKLLQAGKEIPKDTVAYPARIKVVMDTTYQVEHAIVPPPPQKQQNPGAQPGTPQPGGGEAAPGGNAPAGGGSPETP